MKIEVITSFNKKYYDLIGKHCVDTFLMYWPEDLNITCYVEEFSIPEDNRIKQISFDNLDKKYFDFQHEKKVGGNERKFSKKAYSFIHAMENSTADRIIWLDADVLTKQYFPKEILESVLPDDVLSTHLGVTYVTDKGGNSGNWFVPETGFFAVNTNHKKFKWFSSEYRRRYDNIEFDGLRRKYDNDVYGDTFIRSGAKGLDLCEGLTKGYKTPFKRTVIGPYLNHYKAKGNKENFASLDV